jgi:hypothetical protein
MPIRGVKSTHTTHYGNARIRPARSPVLVDTVHALSIMGSWLWSPRESTFQPLGRSDGRAAENPRIRHRVISGAGLDYIRR